MARSLVASRSHPPLHAALRLRWASTSTLFLAMLLSASGSVHTDDLEDAEIDVVDDDNGDQAPATLEEVLSELRQLRVETAELRMRLDRCACSRGPYIVTGDKDASADEEHPGEDRSLEDIGDVAGPLVRVNVQNTEWMKEVLFGGAPWVLQCMDSRAAVAEPHPVLEDAALELKTMATFGLVDCWERMPSGKTLSHRFDFPKPPVTFAVANGDPPVVIDMHGVVKPWQVKRKVGHYLASSIERMDGPKRFKEYCTTRRACLVVGFKTAALLASAMRTLSPLLETHRGVRAVAVDTTVWKVKLDEKLAATKPKKANRTKTVERADLLCLSRHQGSSSRAGAFFRPGDLNPDWVADFLTRCTDARSLVAFTKMPQLLTRPPEQPKSSSASKSSSSAGASQQSQKGFKTKKEQPKKKQGKSKDKKGRNADVVGSRQRLDEEEEPTVVALDESEVEALAEETLEDEDADAEEVEL